MKEGCCTFFVCLCVYICPCAFLQSKLQILHMIACEHHKPHHATILPTLPIFSKSITHPHFPFPHLLSFHHPHPYNFLTHPSLPPFPYHESPSCVPFTTALPPHTLQTLPSYHSSSISTFQLLTLSLPRCLHLPTTQTPFSLPYPTICPVLQASGLASGSFLSPTTTLDASSLLGHTQCSAHKW